MGKIPLVSTEESSKAASKSAKAKNYKKRRKEGQMNRPMKIHRIKSEETGSELEEEYEYNFANGGIYKKQKDKFVRRKQDNSDVLSPSFSEDSEVSNDDDSFTHK